MNEREIEPRYLEAMSLLMAESLSAAEAIKAVHIIDTVVWDQVRLLPLELDKDYQNMQRKLKRLIVKDLETSSREETVDDVDTQRDCDPVKIEFLQKEIQKKKDSYETNRMNRRTIRRNHHLLAVSVEGNIAKELIEHGGFVIPDGTT